MFNSNSYRNTYSYNNPNGAFPQTLGNPNSFNNFNTTQHSLIEQQQNNNLHNTLHDNLNDNIKAERIKEYQITIDSIDRNINIYPDPFSFRLTMSPTSSSTIIRDGNKKEIITSFDSPNINRNFRNVKYIKVDSVIMPKFYDLKEVEIENEDNEEQKLTEFVEDEDKDTTKERFILLRFSNISNTTTIGTNDVSNNHSILLYPYKQYNSSFSLFKPVNMNTNIVCVSDSNLININNVEFSFYDGQYNKIEFSNKKISVDENNEEDDEQISEEEQILNEKNNDMRNPLNISKQVVINMRIGVIENNMNTEVNYR